jgi:hypothetical protein
MTILPDGRWRMSSAEMTNRVWEKLTSWSVDPSDPRCLIPNFPPCTRRSLTLICQPCGKLSNHRYTCTKFNDMSVSVTYCKDCAERGENDVPLQQSTEVQGPSRIDTPI